MVSRPSGVEARSSVHSVGRGVPNSCGLSLNAPEANKAVHGLLQ